MQKRKFGKRSRNALAGAAGTLAAAVCGSIGFVSHAGAASINVAMADASTTATTGNSSNQGINPISYTPKVTSIPYAGSSTYDAADKNDSGTDWNSVEGVSTAPTVNSSGSTVNVLYEQNLSLVDSGDNATGVTLNISAIEPNNKGDSIHPNGNVVTGTDSLAPNPANSTPVTGTGPDGYGTSGSSHDELMTPSWIANGATEGFLFTLNGLTPNGVYNLYVYGAGSAVGQGGTFALTDSSGNVTGGSVTTNSGATTLFKSVFTGPTSSTLVTAGESWNVIQATANGSGSLSFSELSSETTSPIKPAINGFQLDAVPEPTSLGLIALGGFGLLGRRRRSSL